MGLEGLGLLGAADHTFAAVMQGLVTAGVGSAFTYPSPTAPTGRFAALFLLNLCFACGVAEYRYLPLIWESVTRGKGGTKGLADLNQTLMS